MSDTALLKRLERLEADTPAPSSRPPAFFFEGDPALAEFLAKYPTPPGPDEPRSPIVFKRAEEVSP